MQIHYFFIDYGNSGHYYRIGIECENRVVAEGYLQEHSNDVRYHKSGEKGRRDTGNRKIPIGTIRYAKYITDKCSTFTSNRCKSLAIDFRHQVVDV